MTLDCLLLQAREVPGSVCRYRNYDDPIALQITMKRENLDTVDKVTRASRISCRRGTAGDTPRVPASVRLSRLMPSQSHG